MLLALPRGEAGGPQPPPPPLPPPPPPPPLLLSQPPPSMPPPLTLARRRARSVGEPLPSSTLSDPRMTISAFGRAGRGVGVASPLSPPLPLLLLLLLSLTLALPLLAPAGLPLTLTLGEVRSPLVDTAPAAAAAAAADALSTLLDIANRSASHAFSSTATFALREGFFSVRTEKRVERRDTAQKTRAGAGVGVYSLSPLCGHTTTAMYHI